MAKKKLPPSTSSAAWDSRERNVDYDGVNVEHVLDYYFPEWRHRDGRSKLLAEGTYGDGLPFRVIIPPWRLQVIREERKDWRRTVNSFRSVWVSSPKSDIDSMFGDDDVMGPGTDPRFLSMVRDLRKK